MSRNTHIFGAKSLRIFLKFSRKLTSYFRSVSTSKNVTLELPFRFYSEIQTFNTFTCDFYFSELIIQWTRVSPLLIKTLATSSDFSRIFISVKVNESQFKPIIFVIELVEIRYPVLEKFVISFFEFQVVLSYVLYRLQYTYSWLSWMTEFKFDIWRLRGCTLAGTVCLGIHPQHSLTPSWTLTLLVLASFLRSSLYVWLSDCFLPYCLSVGLAGWLSGSLLV